MAEALASMLLNDELRLQMAKVMQDRVGFYYHKNRVTRLYEELFAELMTPSTPLPDLKSQ
jgi:hypothetical protein